MPGHHVDIFAFDVDGFLWHHKAQRLLVKIINDHYDFLQKYKNGRANRSEEELKEIDTTVSRILFEIAHTDLNTLNTVNFFSGVTNHQFQALVCSFLEDEIDTGVDALATAMSFNIGYIRNIDKSIFKAILEKANPQLFRFLDNILSSRTGDSKYVVISNASACQSYELDNLGLKTKYRPPFFLDLPEIAAILQEHNPDFKIIVNEIVTPDVYGDLKRGKSFKWIKEEYEHYSHLSIPYYKHRHHVQDDSKTTIIYMIGHDGVEFLPEKLGLDPKETKFTLSYGDDRLDILFRLKKLFEKFPQLQPNNLKLNLYNYAGDEPELIASIEGTGPPDRNYRKTMKLMVRMCGCDPMDSSCFIEDLPSLIDVPLLLSLRGIGAQQVPYAGSFLSLFGDQNAENAAPPSFDPQVPVTSNSITTPTI